MTVFLNREVGINSHPFGRAWSKVKEVVNIKKFYAPFPQ